MTWKGRLPIDVTLTPVRITIIYASLAFAALYVFDVVLVDVIERESVLREIQGLKGAVEICLTAGLVYVLTSTSRRSLERKARQLRDYQQELRLLQRVLRHNIRNDVNVIRGYASVVREGGIDRTLESNLERVIESSDGIIKYTEHARRISEVIGEGGDERFRYDVRDVVETVLDSTARREATVRVDVPDDVIVEANRTFEPALEEVVANAIEHNDAAEPEVRIDVCEEDGSSEMVEIVVSDNGPGIPEHEREVLRRQAETKLTHASGLGLWLVYWSVHRSGGELHIGDNDPRGSVVRIRLPRANRFGESIGVWGRPPRATS